MVVLELEEEEEGLGGRGCFCPRTCPSSSDLKLRRASPAGAPTTGRDATHPPPLSFKISGGGGGGVGGGGSSRGSGGGGGGCYLRGSGGGVPAGVRGGVLVFVVGSGGGSCRGSGAG